MVEQQTQSAQPTQHSPQDLGHGNTPAAWTGVAILLAGTLLICLGIVLAKALLWIPGVILLPVGVFTWAAMNRAGYNTERRH